MQEYLEKTRQELRLRNYSAKTVKAYLGCLREYFDFKKFNLEKIDEGKIKQFLLNKQDRDYSSQTVNLYLNAIKFFYREVLKTLQKINLKFAKRNKKLPIILSREEIKNIIDAIRNPKHKLIISLAYGAGLRISEAIGLKVKDINLEELTIHLKNAKGKKDRITIFPEKIRSDLQDLMTGKNLNDYLFESEARRMAEEVGFEPTVHQRRTRAFQARAIGHYATPPNNRLIIQSLKHHKQAKRNIYSEGRFCPVFSIPRKPKASLLPW